MSQHNCSKLGPTPGPAAAQPTTPDCMVHSDAPEACNYEKSLAQQGRRANYTHCGLFGDPHLRTFSDDFQTCKVRGAWPLIDNSYLFVQVTNVAVVHSSSATAVSKITIIFKSFQECVEQKVYQAETDDLPAAFVDGSRNGGDKQGANSLWVTEKMGGQQVEIQARYIGTTVVVRQVGRYLTFAIRMPQEVMNAFEENQGLQLCLRGCPTNERMDWALLQGRSPQDGSAAAAANARCKEKLPVEDLYFRSCVFDLLITGDANFTMAAYYALQDAKSLHSNQDKFHIYPRTAELPPGNSGPPALASPPIGLLLLLLCWMCCSLPHL
ncbi:repulsive guidance molecule A [Rhinoraja longicauda]